MYPAPSAARKSVLAVQPYYYHSAVYVDHTRNDIGTLLAAFREACTSDTVGRSFAVFTAVWKQCGWDLVHLKVLDPRGREAFLDVTLRLFLEVVLDQEEHALTRLAAVYGLYTFVKTQPRPAVPLFTNPRVPICFDDLGHLTALPQALDPPLQQHCSLVLLRLFEAHTFLILPDSKYHPMSPRTLPTYTLAILAPPTAGTKKKPGRQPVRTKVAGADSTLGELEKMVEKLDEGQQEGSGGPDTLQPYLDAKAKLLKDAESEMVGQASQKAVARLQKIAEMYPSGRETERPSRVQLLKAEEVVDKPGGLMNLVQPRAAHEGTAGHQTTEDDTMDTS